VGHERNDTQEKHETISPHHVHTSVLTHSYG